MLVVLQAMASLKEDRVDLSRGCAETEDGVASLPEQLWRTVQEHQQVTSLPNLLCMPSLHSHMALNIPDGLGLQCTHAIMSCPASLP